MKIQLKDLERLGQIGGFIPIVLSHENGFSIRLNINDDEQAILVAKHTGKERNFKNLDTVYRELIKLGFNSFDVYKLD